MKQYTTYEQTSKLIELGFAEPSMKNILDTEGIINEEWYSIGELIEMLPKIHPSYHDPYCLDIGFDAVNWVVGYVYDHGYIEIVSSKELIDALFKMVIKLKETI